MDNSLCNNSQYFLSLQASGQHIALMVDNIKEVIETDLLVKVPGALPLIAGLVNVRGKVITVIDTGVLLNTSSVLTNNSASVVVVLNHGEDLHGLLVNFVGEVLAVDRTNIESLPNNLTDSIKAISDGVYKSAQNLYTIISIDKLVNYYA